MSKETGGNAFPDGSTNEWGNATNGGMTLRDYFAAKMMQAIITNEAEVERIRQYFNNENPLPAIASMSYYMADAMLKERNK